MTNEDLDKYISNYCRKRWDIPIASYQISENVDLAFIWPCFRPDQNVRYSSERFFFVKGNHQWVAVVCDMGHDIHWFVQGQHRGNGYLCNALESTIFPYLMEDREDQELRATAVDEKGRRYLERRGFVERSENGKVAYFLGKDQTNVFDVSGISHKQLSVSQLDRVRKEASAIASEIVFSATCLQRAYGDFDSVWAFESTAEDALSLGLMLATPVSGVSGLLKAELNEEDKMRVRLLCKQIREFNDVSTGPLTLEALDRMKYRLFATSSGATMIAEKIFCAYGDKSVDVVEALNSLCREVEALAYATEVFPFLKRG